MTIRADVEKVDQILIQRAASHIPNHAGRVLSAVEEAAENSKLWWGAAVVMAAVGGRRGWGAAGFGLSALALAQFMSNGLCKRLADRPRPPKEWIPHKEVHDRPESSSFPSGHTAAAVAFTATITTIWPAAGALCAIPAAMVGLERIQSGAHYPSDVAGGAAIGLACAWMTRRTPSLLRRHAT
ncbi:phosphatase PAP2 family protein [Streptomyces sp. NPDC047869]|uniref:phosphatase PAP2 family protein n=1 Tax=Streptomyces sp. NPDC047869 TaxID=3154709 RepID=UPI0034518F75